MKIEEMREKTIEIVNIVAKYAFKGKIDNNELINFEGMGDENNLNKNIVNILFEIRKWIEEKDYGKNEKKYEELFPLTVSYEKKRENFDAKILKIPSYSEDGIRYVKKNNQITTNIENIEINININDFSGFQKIKRKNIDIDTDIYRYRYINELDHFFTYWLYKIIKPSKNMPSNLEPGLYLILLDCKEN